MQAVWHVIVLYQDRNVALSSSNVIHIIVTILETENKNANK